MPNPILGGTFVALMARAFIVGVQDADKTLDANSYKNNEAFLAQCGSRSGGIITVPMVLKVSIWQADPANPYDVTIKRGTKTETLEPGQIVTLVTDGTANGISASELTGSVISSAWQAIAEDFTFTAGMHVDADTSAGAITGTLPLSPAKYDQVYIRNSANSFATHALTIARNGQTIMGLAEDMAVNTDGADFSLWFDGTTWRLA